MTRTVMAIPAAPSRGRVDSDFATFGFGSAGSMTEAAGGGSGALAEGGGLEGGGAPVVEEPSAAAVAAAASAVFSESVGLSECRGLEFFDVFFGAAATEASGFTGASALGAGGTTGATCGGGAGAASGAGACVSCGAGSALGGRTGAASDVLVCGGSVGRSATGVGDAVGDGVLAAGVLGAGAVVGL